MWPWYAIWSGNICHKLLEDSEKTDSGTTVLESVFCTGKKKPGKYCGYWLTVTHHCRTYRYGKTIVTVCLTFENEAFIFNVSLIFQGCFAPRLAAESVERLDEMTEQHITSRQNPLLVHTKKLLSSRAYRMECGEFAADGTKLLEEAARWEPGLHTVVAQEDTTLCKLPEQVRVVRVPADVMKSISQMDAPQGAVFLCRMPQAGTPEIVPGTLLLDGIQDPGNVGTILRTADALDVPVILLDGCADAYNPKTVRASMGAVFRTRVQTMKKEDAMRCCRASGIPILATALHEDAKDLRLAELTKAAVVIGSEGQGICRELLEAADGRIIIPMTERCESLNAAAAATIVMWQMKR